MILTDGEISDMYETKDIIVQCSKYPISIVIVGVGNGNFSMMKELDGDKYILKDSSGRMISRDIV